VIERDLGIAGPTATVERRLEVACALVHALVGRPASSRPASGRPAEQDEAIAVFEELPLPAAVFDAGPAPRLANAAWRALLGAGSGAFPYTYVDEVIRTGAVRHLAELELALDGRPVHCAATLRPIHDDAGQATGVIVLCILTTDEVIARELGVSADALVWGGPVSRGADYYSGAWRAYTRAARRVARRSAWQDAIHPDDRSSCVLALGEVTGQVTSQATSQARAVEIEARVLRADGVYRWHRIWFVSTPAARWYAAAADIEDQRAEAARAELLARERAARAEVEQTSRLKDQFLAAVSHELRAPLTTMLLWERVLRDETAGVALHAQALDAIHQSALFQSRLVDDLLDVSRAVSGKLHVDLRPLDIETVLRSALEAIAPAALAKQIVLDRRGARVAVEVDADEARLRQVLGNLLANAVKFTDPGGRITVVVTRQERTIAIGVEDSGRGIAPDFLPHVFEPFSQIEDSLAGENHGLGMGLAIAKQIVALHCGELTAASAGPGRGSTFTLRLPIADERRARPSPGDPARKPMLAHIRVLVVDDEPRVRDALALLLERAGAVVDTAESAETARIRIKLQAPEALVCDIAMPGEDGNSFIRDLRASGRDLPAIALTAHAMESDVERALAAGFDLHVAKPIDFERLVESIGALVAARRVDARA
jgi:signal transduction histidine kinase/ActR/RegA family two-component response regulator